MCQVHTWYACVCVCPNTSTLTYVRLRGLECSIICVPCCCDATRAGASQHQRLTFLVMLAFCHSCSVVVYTDLVCTSQLTGTALPATCGNCICLNVIIRQMHTDSGGWEKKHGANEGATHQLGCHFIRHTLLKQI